MLAFISLGDVGDSLREGFFMFWETLWALVLGLRPVGRGAGVRVARRRCSARSATTGPPAVARATGFGMVSSSCSYAATAMAKSLFQKGADFVDRDGVHVRLDEPRASSSASCSSC